MHMPGHAIIKPIHTIASINMTNDNIVVTIQQIIDGMIKQSITIQPILPKQNTA